MRCYCHDVAFESNERAWLKDDGTVLCDDGHSDEQRDDPFDNFDHGTPYSATYLSLIKEGTIA